MPANRCRVSCRITKRGITVNEGLYRRIERTTIGSRRSQGIYQSNWGIIRVPDDNFFFKAMPDGFLVLLPRVWEEPRNLYFYEFDGTLRWRVAKNPWKQTGQFINTEILNDERIFGMLDPYIGDIFEIDRMTGEIIGHEHDPKRCYY